MGRHSRDKRCWKVRIEGRERRRQFYQAYWTDAVTLGRAIKRVLFVAEMCGVKDPIARAADSLPDYLVLRELLHEMVREQFPRLGELLPPQLEEERWPTPTEDVLCAPRCYFPVHVRFVAPFGTIESCSAWDLGSTRTRAGYVHSPRHAERLVAVAGRHQLEPLFASLLELLRRVYRLKIECVSCARQETACLATTRAMHAPGAVLGFLTEHGPSLLHSGFVRITATDARYGTRVQLDEHKVLRIACASAAMLRRAEDVLVRHGVRPRTEVLLPQQFPHLHYRPPGSLGARGLRAMLEREGFWCRDPMDLESIVSERARLE